MPRRRRKYKRSRDRASSFAARAEPRSLNRYRREVIALLKVGHKVRSQQALFLIRKWDRQVRAAWRRGKPPCNVADTLYRLCKHTSTKPRFSSERPHPTASHSVRDRGYARTRRDADTPHKGEVFETRAGNRWEVEEVTDKRVKVKRKGHRSEGPFTWGRSTLKGMKSLSGVSHAKTPEPASSKSSSSGGSFFSTFLGDPNRRHKKSKKTLTRKRRPKTGRDISPAKRKWIAKKIAFLRREGHPRLTAIAIAYRMAGVPRPRGLRTKHLTSAERRQERKIRSKTDLSRSERR
jgi:hypothetical protein